MLKLKLRLYHQLLSKQVKISLKLVINKPLLSISTTED